MPRREYDHDDEGFGEASRYTAHLDRGWSLLDRGDYQRARNSAHQALKLRPEVPDAAMLMAAICLAESDPESSLEWYERAIEADADYVDAQLAAAQVLLYDLEDPQRALARAASARDLDEATPADQLDFGLLEIEALVSIGDRNGAAERLDQLAELWLVDELLDADTPREKLPDLLREFAGEAHELEQDDLDPIMGRLVQIAARIARLHVELGAPEDALPWLDGLLRRFGDDADVWYLCNEAAYMAGEPVRAAHAALQVLQLDARIPLPEWAPDPAEIHTRVVNLLVNANDPGLRGLAREPGFVVVVNEAPPFELVLEGVDPRARALSLAARSVRETEGSPTLTGLALYRRNLVRLAREPAALDRELEFAVFDELAMFYGYDDARREQIGLPASEWSPLEPRGRPREPEPAPESAKHQAASPKPRKKKAKTAGKTKKKSTAGKGKKKSTAGKGKKKSTAGNNKKKSTAKPAAQAKPKPKPKPKKATRKAGKKKPAKPVKPSKRKSTAKQTPKQAKLDTPAKPKKKPSRAESSEDPIDE